MISEKEFLEIVEKHLIIREDGSVYIKNADIAKKYENFLKQNAKKEGKADTKLDNIGCANVVCW